MKVSVIMPSYLGYYENCAEDREEKFLRAVNTFLANTYDNKELIVVGDNCKITERLIRENFVKELMKGNIKFINMPKKQPLFSGKLRSVGIENATGDLIMYLDSDDMLGDTHIETVAGQMESDELDWCYYNDFILTKEGVIPKDVELEYERAGTSSVAHLNHPEINWDGCDGYGHDWKFIQKLMKLSDNHSKVFGATYVICHIPSQIDE